MLTKKANRTASESQEHIDLIKMMVSHFQNQGYKNIRADLPDYSQPASLSEGLGNNYIPDLTCNKNDYAETRIILEAETCGTITSEHTAGQWKAFAKSGSEFHLAVPKQCGSQTGREKAQSRLAELRISAISIWAPQ